MWFISDLLMKLNPNDAMLVTHGGQAVPRDVMVGKHVCPGHGLAEFTPHPLNFSPLLQGLHTGAVNNFL